MRKLITLLLFSLFALPGWAVTCTVTGSDYATNFIICANDPLTDTIAFAPLGGRGYGDIYITATNPAVDLTGLTILVPPKIRLIFSGNVFIDAATNFQTSGGGTQGNSEVQFGIDGTVYKGNPGANGFDVLNGLIVSCSTNPNPMECLEIQSFLPVELTSFSGFARANQVELNWTTASELNNDFFTVEHSHDGYSFRAIGNVKGAGTSSEEVRYQFLHRQPAAGTNYYRLKQVDYDGQFEYSDLIAVDMNLRNGGVQVYPNPTIDRVVIQLGERPERSSLLLTNILGQGIDIIPLVTDLGWEISLGELQAGMYMLRVEADGKTFTKQIVKR